MSLFSLLVRFSLLFTIFFVIVTILMIFIIALLQLPPVIETYIPYVLVWVVSFYVLNQYNHKNKRLISKAERWKIIALMTLVALVIGIIFSFPVYSEHLMQDSQALLLGVLFAFPAYAVLIWSAEHRSTQKLLKAYPELQYSSRTP